MSHDFDNYAERAEEALYRLPGNDDEENRYYVARGQGWAVLALAAAVQELAEARRRS